MIFDNLYLRIISPIISKLEATFSIKLLFAKNPRLFTNKIDILSNQVTLIALNILLI